MYCVIHARKVVLLMIVLALIGIDPQFRQGLAEALGQGIVRFLDFYRLEQSE